MRNASAISVKLNCYYFNLTEIDDEFEMKIIKLPTEDIKCDKGN